ncbi:MAG: hypothetical protein JW822_06900 [Spirochaetales bacterium]|nr:hypothetical protein [Spirochaetales bacterium]
MPFPVAGNKLIWGFPLIRQARDLGIEQVLCRDFSEFKMHELLQLALVCEDRKGSYSWQEKENIVLFCEKHKLSLIDHDVTALIENHSDPDFYQKVKRYSAYPEALKGLLNKNLIDGKTAERISVLPRLFFQKLLRNAKKFTFAERRIFCSYVFEIVGRDTLNAEQAEKLVRKIFSFDTPLQKIREIRYPKLSDLERRLADYKKQYFRGSGIVLHEPPYFEGNAFTLTFSFENKQQYEKKITKLARLKENIHEICRLLH